MQDSTQVARVLGTLRGAFVAADAGGTICCVNPGAERLLGWDRGMLMGRPLTTIIPERMHQAHKAGLQHFLATGESHLVGRPVRVPALGQDGAEREVDLTVLAYEDPHGIVTLVAGLQPPGEASGEVLMLDKALAAAHHRALIGPGAP